MGTQRTTILPKTWRTTAAWVWIVAIWAAPFVSAIKAENQKDEPKSEGQKAWHIWTLARTERVLRQTEPGKDLEVDLAACRGEWESFQILMRSPAPVPGVRVEPGDLIGPGGHRLSAHQAELYRQHQLHITIGTYRNTEFKPDWYPDALIPARLPAEAVRVEKARYTAMPFDLPAGETHGFWVDIYVPPGTPAGLYQGSYRLLAADGRKTEIPIRVTVWDFDLPRVSSLYTAFGSPGASLRGYYERRAKAGKEAAPKDWAAIDAQCAQLLSQHRINATPPPGALTPQVEPDGSFRIPDQQIQAFQEFVDRYHVNAYCIPHPSSVVKDPQTEEAKLRAWFKAWDEAIQKIDRPVLFYTYLRDEPNDEEAYRYVQRWGRAIRQLNSRVKVLVVEQTWPQNEAWGDLYGAVDIWCPLFSLFKPGSAAQRQALGEMIWTYTALCQGKPTPWWHTDYPLLHYRIPTWIAWRYRMRGLLYWSLVFWNQVEDPWTQPWTYDRRAEGKGKGPVFNGEGSLLYPARAVGFEGVVPSLRLKALRDGIEDYDYLALLERLGRAADAEKIVVELAPSWFEWDPDPAAWQSARRKLAELIRPSQKAALPPQRWKFRDSLWNCAETGFLASRQAVFLNAGRAGSLESGKAGWMASAEGGSPTLHTPGDQSAHRPTSGMQQTSAVRQQAAHQPHASGQQQTSREQQAVGKRPASGQQEASGEQEAVVALQALGAGVKTNAQGRVVLVDLGGGKATDESAKHLARLSQLRSLRWSGPEVTDAVVDVLLGLPNLKVLKLDETRLTDAGLARLKNLSQLEELYLARTRITDTGLEHVGQMAGLRRLRLSETRISGSGLAKLANLRQLAELDISRTAVDDASLAVLTKLPKLTRLNLYTTPITDAALEHLAQMTELTWLNLDNTQVTDAGVPKLRSLKKLEFLHLGRTHITDAVLEPLAELKSLKTLHLTNTAVTAAGAARLQKLLPECKILAGTTGESKPDEPAKQVLPSTSPNNRRPPPAGQDKPPAPSQSPASEETNSAELGPPDEPAKPPVPSSGPVGQTTQPASAPAVQVRGVQVRLECTVRQYDPAKPEGLLIGVVENLSDQPVEIPAGYESDRLLLWAKADQHPMPSAYWDRSRQKPSIPLVRLAPGQKQEVFRWPLAQVLADRHKTWRADYQAGKRLLVWDWEHHAHPPYSPIYQVNSTQLVPKAYFWLELQLDGQTLRSETLCLEVKPSSGGSSAGTEDPTAPKNGTW